MRLFTAIELPPDLQARVAEAQATLRAAGVRARWAAAERAHLTVHFLGERPEAEVAGLEAALREACAGLAPVALAVGGLGKFRSGVLWLGVQGDLGPLERACARTLGLPEAPFRPHITLARGFQGRLAELPMFEPPYVLTAEALTFFRSELRPAGAAHHVLARITLGQPTR